MNTITLGILAAGLSMDCFAVAIGAGFTNKNLKFKQILLFSFIFALFHFVMPLLGWFLGDTFRFYVKAFDFWVAFSLLTLIGLKMITDSFKAHKKTTYTLDKPVIIILLSIATSIDAFIVGLPLALLDFHLLTSALVISLFAFIFSVAGFYLGRKFGCACGSKAGVFGGTILIAIGVKILLENLA